MKSGTQIFCLLMILFLVGFTYTSCNKDEEDLIPYVYVNFAINPGSIEYGDLDIPGNFAYVTGGYRGIVIYHYTQDQFIAYDRACTFDPQDPDARVEVGEGLMIMECPVCGSKYLLVNGDRFDGPAIRPLRIYQTHYDGNTLYVSN